MDETVQIGLLHTEEDAKAYNRFLAVCPAAMVYHSLPYRNLLVHCLKSEPHYALAWRGHDVIGVLPVMLADGPFGTVANSLPFFGSHGDVLSIDPVAAGPLQAWYERFLLDRNIGAATIITNPFDAAPAASWTTEALVDERIAQWTPMQAGDAFASRLLEMIDSSARRNIRKAQSEGVVISIDNGAVEFLAETHQQNMQAIGGRVKPAQFFTGLIECLVPGKDYDIYVADIGGKRVAALLLFYFKEFVEYIMPVTREGSREAQPTAAILYTAMCETARRGFRIWNWGGTWISQTGVYRFKRKWGAEESRYRYHTRIRDESLLIRTAEQLTQGYPFYFIAPFSSLRDAGREPSAR